MLPRPSDERCAQAVANLLRLLVQHLLRQFLPGKSQVPFHGNEPQPDGASRRKQQGAGVIVIAFAAEVLLDGIVGQVASGDDVGQFRARRAARCAGCGPGGLQ